MGSGGGSSRGSGGSDYGNSDAGGRSRTAESYREAANSMRDAGVRNLSGQDRTNTSTGRSSSTVASSSNGNARGTSDRTSGSGSSLGGLGGRDSSGALGGGSGNGGGGLGSSLFSSTPMAQQGNQLGSAPLQTASSSIAFDGSSIASRGNTLSSGPLYGSRSVSTYDALTNPYGYERESTDRAMRFSGEDRTGKGSLEDRPMAQIEWRMGPKRPNKPTSGIDGAVRSVVGEQLGEDYTVRVISGMGNYGAKHRHPTGAAIDFDVIDPKGKRITDPATLDKLVIEIAARTGGSIGMAHDGGYMGKGRMHADFVKPHSAESAGWSGVKGRRTNTGAEAIEDDIYEATLRGPESGPLQKPAANAPTTALAYQLPTLERRSAGQEAISDAIATNDSPVGTTGLPATERIEAAYLSGGAGIDAYRGHVDDLKAPAKLSAGQNVEEQYPEQRQRLPEQSPAPIDAGPRRVATETITSGVSPSLASTITPGPASPSGVPVTTASVKSPDAQKQLSPTARTLIENGVDIGSSFLPGVGSLIGLANGAAQLTGRGGLGSWIADNIEMSLNNPGRIWTRESMNDGRDTQPAVKRIDQYLAPAAETPPPPPAPPPAPAPSPYTDQVRFPKPWERWGVDAWKYR